jgi:hypothetical protein
MERGIKTDRGEHAQFSERPHPDLAVVERLGAFLRSPPDRGVLALDRRLPHTRKLFDAGTEYPPAWIRGRDRRELHLLKLAHGPRHG